MYSRRTVRPASGGGNIPSPSERPTLPPDYAGIAFRAPEDRTLQDYPETIIPPAVEPDEPAEASLAPAEDAEPAAPVFLFDNEGMTDGFEDVASPCLPTEEPNEPTDHENEGETPPHDGSFALPHEQEPSVPPPSAPTDSAENLSDWFEALKMEDLLLFWMLFRLLYGKNREELEILLCLLLFAR